MTLIRILRGAKKIPDLYTELASIYIWCVPWSNKRHKKGTSNILNCRRHCYIYHTLPFFRSCVCVLGPSIRLCVGQQSVLELVTTICSWRERWEHPTLAPLSLFNRGSPKYIRSPAQYQRAFLFIYACTEIFSTENKWEHFTETHIILSKMQS